MRVIIQRVESAGVRVDSKMIGEISKGLLILVGVTHEDNSEDVEWICKKIAHLRIFDDQEGMMNLSLKDIGGEALVVSQFTLYAATKKGNRPSYVRAARPNVAEELYQGFVRSMEKQGIVVRTGQFGAMMKVSLINDGPVTIQMDSKNRE